VREISGAAGRANVLAAREREDRILAYLEEHGESRGAEIARALKLSGSQVGTSLLRLAAAGRAASNGKGGKGCAYHAVGRQTSTRKASRPVKGADEEEGGAVKLSIVSPTAPAPSRGGAPGPETSQAALAAVLHAITSEPRLTKDLLEELPFGSRAIHKAVEALHGAGRIEQDRRGAPWRVTETGRVFTIVPKPKPLPAADGTAERRESVLAVVRARGPIRWLDVVAEVHGGTCQASSQDLIALAKAGRIFYVGVGKETIVALDRALLPVPAAPPSERRVLPLLELGAGERHDECANYDGCLDRYVRRFPRLAASPARCPSSCSSFAPVPAHVRHSLAHTFGRRGTPVAI
jgi:hypothetical protein